MSTSEKSMTERSTVHSTFVIERTYAASPERVFAAWSDRAAKARWFGPGEKHAESYSLDFREGGREHLSVPTPDGAVYSFDAVYADIVPAQRIVHTRTTCTATTPGSRCRSRRSNSRRSPIPRA